MIEKIGFNADCLTEDEIFQDGMDLPDCLKNPILGQFPEDQKKTALNLIEKVKCQPNDLDFFLHAQLLALHDKVLICCPGAIVSENNVLCRADGEECIKSVSSAKILPMSGSEY